MQWSTEPHAGFTKAERPILPVIDRGPYGYEHVNVAEQRRDPDSFLNWTERAIRMRKEVPEIGWGDFTVLSTGSKDVFALRYDWRNNAVVFLHNLSGVPREISFKSGPGRSPGEWLVNLLSSDHSRANSAGTHRVLMEPYGYRWYRLGGLDYLLKRSEV
jgi:maltose alpha-D-glucosyltransferase/alpha-amylase